MIASQYADVGLSISLLCLPMRREILQEAFWREPRDLQRFLQQMKNT